MEEKDELILKVSATAWAALLEELERDAVYKPRLAALLAERWEA